MLRIVQNDGKARVLKPSAWNEMARAVNKVNNPAMGGIGGMPNEGFALNGALACDGLNSTDADINAFSVMGIKNDYSVDGKEAVKDSFHARRLLELEEISLSKHGSGNWCITARDIAKNATAKVYIQGIVPAILKVENEDHAYADITDGEDYLTSCAFGPVRILDKESGTGEKWATVAIGIDPHEFDIVVSASTIPAYGAMEIYGIAANGAYQVRKPTADSLNQILMADGFDIPAATPMPIRRTWPKQVLLNGTAPAIGESIGSVNGQNYMQSGKTGFLHMGASGGRASVRPFNQRGTLVTHIYLASSDLTISPSVHYGINRCVRVTIPDFPQTTKWNFTVDDICAIGPTWYNQWTPQNNYKILLYSNGFMLSDMSGWVDSRTDASLYLNIGGGVVSESMDGFTPAQMNALYDSAGIPRIETGDTLTIEQLSDYGLDINADGSLDLWVTFLGVGSGYVDLYILRA